MGNYYLFSLINYVTMIAYSSSPDNGAPSTSTAGTSQQPIMFGGMFSLSNS
jgi:hypothetical protein